jgi:hypothetical protein
VTNNPNPAATGTTGAAVYNSSHNNQPASLGIMAYGFGMTDSKPAVASVVDSSGTGGTTTSQRGAATANWTIFAPGNVDDAGGGILTYAPESAGVLPGFYNADGTLATNTGYFGTGGGGPAELLNSLEIQVNSGFGGTAVFTPTDQVGPGNVGLVVYKSGGTSATSAPVYGSVVVYSGDGNTVNNLPALTVDVVQQVPEPASAATMLIGAIGLMLSRRTRKG